MYDDDNNGQASRGLQVAKTLIADQSRDLLLLEGLKSENERVKLCSFVELLERNPALVELLREHLQGQEV